MELYETKENRGQDVKVNVTGPILEGVPRWEGGLVRSRGSGWGRIIISTFTFTCLFIRKNLNC